MMKKKDKRYKPNKSNLLLEEDFQHIYENKTEENQTDYFYHYS